MVSDEAGAVLVTELTESIEMTGRGAGGSSPPVGPARAPPRATGVVPTGE
jgi:hypothetical protein